MCTNGSGWCCHIVLFDVIITIIMARSKTRRSKGFSVFQPKDGRWGWAVVVEYDQVTGNPKRIQGTERSQDEASGKAIDASAKVRAGAQLPEGRDKTVGEYLDEWLEVYVKPHREPKTYAYYAGMVKHH